MDDSLIREGLVTVHRKGRDNRVLFYNPTQVFNRDLSLVVLRTFIAIEKQKIESNPKLGRFVGVNILENLAATGIRGIRYLKELGELVNLVTFNDLDRNSAEMIAVNAELNELNPRRFRVTCCDANLLSMILTPPPDVAKSFQMAGNINKIPPGAINEANTVLKEFNKSVDGLLKVVALTQAEPPEAEGPAAEYRNIVDVVDLDPYSSATGFIDAAVRCVRSGGLVLITSTDMPTLCGNNPLVSFYKYGGTSFKSPFCHELSLRVLLYSVMMTASRYKRVIQPLLSVSVDFYVRVFVRVRYSPEGCKTVAANAGVVLMCVRCHSFKIHKLCEDFVPPEPEEADAQESAAAANGGGDNPHPAKPKRRKLRRAGTPSNLSKTCEECGSRLKMGGPMYTGPLHDKEFVDNALEMNKQIFEPPEGAADSEADPEASRTLSGVTMGKRIRGVLTAIQEEVDVPLFYSVADLCQSWSLSTISPILFKNMLRKMGFRASNFHRDPNSLKTDAPNHAVMDVIREHAKNSSKLSDHEFFKRNVDTAGIDFDLKVERGKHVPKWMPNPTSHWGPKKMHRTCSSSIKP